MLGFGIVNRLGGGFVYHSPFLPCDGQLTKQLTGRRTYCGSLFRKWPRTTSCLHQWELEAARCLLVGQEAGALARSRARE